MWYWQSEIPSWQKHLSCLFCVYLLDEFNTSCRVLIRSINLVPYLCVLWDFSIFNSSFRKFSSAWSNYIWAMLSKIKIKPCQFMACIVNINFSLLDAIKCINTLRPGQNWRHFADDSFKCIFLNENVWIPTKISLKFVPQGPINNISALVQIMAWCRPGDKPIFWTNDG